MTPETKVRRDGWLDGSMPGADWFVDRYDRGSAVAVVILPTDHYEAAVMKLAAELCQLKYELGGYHAGHVGGRACDACLSTVRTTLEESK